jgi:hypothetical protein
MYPYLSPEYAQNLVPQESMLESLISVFFDGVATGQQKI